MRYFIHLSFNGTHYHGWQIQKNAPSIQASIEEALSRILGSATVVTGCGRTDTGVHAKDFRAHFNYSGNSLDCEVLTYKLNAILPRDIYIFNIFPVPEDMHARFHATGRTYRYFVRQNKEPFLNNVSAAPGTYSTPQPNMELMNQAAAALVGTHDFTSFSKLHSKTVTNLCTVKEAFWFTEVPEFALEPFFVFQVTANRFLRDMVRCMVGTLLEIGKKKKPVEWILQLMKEKNRSFAGHSVPAEGLFLWKVTYDNLKTVN
ncbi:MAG: tRNA pseudouridine(38-40) synthase TruA [Bacteroidales bacterium]|nr:tRNA pseudouridine(38-40) synthase TruA [Bacteroidales bacterium]